MLFNRIVRDICSLKIQGAQAVAQQALVAMEDAARHSNMKTPRLFVQELLAARSVLEKTRPTEPCLRNALFYLLHDIDGKEESILGIRKKIANNLFLIREHFASSRQKISFLGSKKITSTMQIYTHCHSSTVVAILLAAKKQRKRFVVNNTETRPSFQGRITARQLAKAGIHVYHYVDAAARLAMQKADLVLLGVDAITADGSVFNKIGTRIVAEMAMQHGIPLYFCADSWKFDPATFSGKKEKIEIRNANEVWRNPPRGVFIQNPIFESVEPKYATAIISELGILKPKIFLRRVETAHAWVPLQK